MGRQISWHGRVRDALAFMVNADDDEEPPRNLHPSGMNCIGATFGGDRECGLPPYRHYTTRLESATNGGGRPPIDVLNNLSARILLFRNKSVDAMSPEAHHAKERNGLSKIADMSEFLIFHLTAAYRQDDGTDCHEGSEYDACLVTRIRRDTTPDDADTGKICPAA